MRKREMGKDGSQREERFWVECEVQTILHGSTGRPKYASGSYAKIMGVTHVVCVWCRRLKPHATKQTCVPCLEPEEAGGERA
jgi:hypothetical protein